MNLPTSSDSIKNVSCDICGLKALTHEEGLELWMRGNHKICQEKGGEGVNFVRAQHEDLEKSKENYE
mgnify:CR=1 FL=1